MLFIFVVLESSYRAYVDMLEKCKENSKICYNLNIRKLQKIISQNAYLKYMSKDYVFCGRFYPDAVDIYLFGQQQLRRPVR